MECCKLDIKLLTDNVTQQNDLLRLQNKFLKEIIKPSKKTEILLDDFCLFAEKLVPDTIALITIYNKDNNTIGVKSAPSAGQSIIDDMQELTPGKHSGSCGYSIFYGKACYTRNTLEDPSWVMLHDFVKTHNIISSWSQPLFFNTNSIIGSFDFYSFEQRVPARFEKQVMQVCADLLSIILQHHKMEGNPSIIEDQNNLTIVDQQIEHAMTIAYRNEKSLSLMFIEADNWENINTDFGDDFGAKALLMTQDVIKNNLRSGDIVFKIKGNKLLIIIENLTKTLLADTVARKILRAFQFPLDIDGIKILVKISIGVSIFPGDGNNAKELKDSAEFALKQAKLSEKSSIEHYKQSLAQKVREKVKYEQDMRESLAHNEFKLYFQPQINLNTNTIDTLESLIRWNHPYEGLLLPEKFINIAEQSGLINELGIYVLREHCLKGCEWVKQGIKLPIMSVNISAVKSSDFSAKTIFSILEETGFPAKCLELEITEELLLNYGNQGRIEMEKCKDIGISLAIDAFGTGYSSLSQLRSLPINKLKIDQSLIHDLEDHKDNQNLVKTFIAMGKSLNLGVVAVGVETQAQQKFLLENGCELIQGFYRHRPKTSDSIERLLISESLRPVGSI